MKANDQLLEVLARNYANGRANLARHQLAITRTKARLEGAKKKVIAQAYKDGKINGKNAQARAAQEALAIEESETIASIENVVEDMEMEGIELMEMASYYEAIYKLRLAAIRAGWEM